jgi:nitrate/nitrite-specific signal transduction histidine kinase
MKIKAKLMLGIVFLFVEFLVITLLSAYSIYTISKQSEKIMKDNNLSIQYAENMQQAIDQINTYQIAILFNPSKRNNDNELSGSYNKFEEYLRKEANNVTEPGEKELLHTLTDEYKSYKMSLSEIHAIKNRSDFYFQKQLPQYHALKSKIYHISEINMQSIMKKNEDVTDYERRSYVILTILASICFLLSVIFMFNFPHIILDPIKQVSESLRGISNRNYDFHLNFRSDDEFKDMEKAIKVIADRLQKYESSNMDSVLNEKEQIVKMIDTMVEKLRIGRDQMNHLDIKKIIDDQSNIVDRLKKELEQSKHNFEKKSE